MEKILILLGSSSDLKITERGLNLLKDAGVGYELRISSAHRTPERTASMVKKFDLDPGAKALICVAGKSAHLAGVAASYTIKPVIAVPVYNQETSGFDALLSISQMPGGVPVSTMGFGNSGFLNACLLCIEIMALSNNELKDFLLSYRKKLEEKVINDDKSLKGS